jgi:hypothetical protein
MDDLLEFVEIMALLEVASAGVAFVGLIAIGLYNLLPRAPLRPSARPHGPMVHRN